MQVWTNLLIIGVTPETPADLVAGRESLVKAAEKIAGERQRLDDDLAALRSADVAEMTKLGTKAAALKDREIGTLQSELALRERLGAWLEQYRSAVALMAGDAARAVDEVRAEVRAKLREIGFIVEPIENPLCVRPGVIMQHPRLRGAFDRANELSGGSGDVSTHSRNNDEATDAVRRRLAAIRTELVGA